MVLLPAQQYSKRFAPHLLLLISSGKWTLANRDSLRYSQLLVIIVCSTAQYYHEVTSKDLVRDIKTVCKVLSDIHQVLVLLIVSPQKDHHREMYSIPPNCAHSLLKHSMLVPNIPQGYSKLVQCNCSPSKWECHSRETLYTSAE